MDPSSFFNFLFCSFWRAGGEREGWGRERERAGGERERGLGERERGRVGFCCQPCVFKVPPNQGEGKAGRGECGLVRGRWQHFYRLGLETGDEVVKD
jgi:hypothetical protein